MQQAKKGLENFVNLPYSAEKRVSSISENVSKSVIDEVIFE